MVTIALHNEARVLTLLCWRMAGSTVCAGCPTGQYFNRPGFDLAAVLLLFSMITQYDLHMVRISAAAQKSADLFYAETKLKCRNSVHTLKQVHHPAKCALKEPTPATKVLRNDFEKETDTYT